MPANASLSQNSDPMAIVDAWLGFRAKHTETPADLTKRFENATRQLVAVMQGENREGYGTPKHPSLPRSIQADLFYVQRQPVKSPEWQGAQVAAFTLSMALNDAQRLGSLRSRLEHAGVDRATQQSQLDDALAAMNRAYGGDQAPHPTPSRLDRRPKVRP